MSDSIRVFLDQRPVDVEAGVTLRDVIATATPQVLPAIDAGKAYVTDGVGRDIDLTDHPEAGAIYRVVRSARRAARDSKSS